MMLYKAFGGITYHVRVRPCLPDRVGDRSIVLSHLREKLIAGCLCLRLDQAFLFEI